MSEAWLTAAEVKTLTERKKWKAQCRMLARMGVPYDLRGKAGSDAESDTEAQDRLGRSDSRVTRRHYRRKPTKATPTR